jgi:hypothetical protein
MRIKSEVEISAEWYKKFWLEQFPGLVFRGQVIKIEEVELKESQGPQELLKVTFRVERYWRGATNSVAVIYTNAGCCACGINYKKGGRYFVNAVSLNGLPVTNICGALTKDEVDEFVKIMGEGQVPGAVQR